MVRVVRHVEPDLGAARRTGNNHFDDCRAVMLLSLKNKHARTSRLSAAQRQHVLGPKKTKSRSLSKTKTTPQQTQPSKERAASSSSTSVLCGSCCIRSVGGRQIRSAAHCCRRSSTASLSAGRKKMLLHRQLPSTQPRNGGPKQGPPQCQARQELSNASSFVQFGPVVDERRQNLRFGFAHQIFGFAHQIFGFAHQIFGAAIVPLTFTKK